MLIHMSAHQRSPFAREPMAGKNSEGELDSIWGALGVPHIRGPNRAGASPGLRGKAGAATRFLMQRSAAKQVPPGNPPVAAKAKKRDASGAKKGAIKPMKPAACAKPLRTVVWRVAGSEANNNMQAATYLWRFALPLNSKDIMNYTGISKKTLARYVRYSAQEEHARFGYFWGPAGPPETDQLCLLTTAKKSRNMRAFTPETRAAFLKGLLDRAGGDMPERARALIEKSLAPC